MDVELYKKSFDLSISGYKKIITTAIDHCYRLAFYNFDKFGSKEDSDTDKINIITTCINRTIKYVIDYRYQYLKNDRYNKIWVCPNEDDIEKIKEDFNLKDIYINHLYSLLPIVSADWSMDRNTLKCNLTAEITADIDLSQSSDEEFQDLIDNTACRYVVRNLPGECNLDRGWYGLQLNMVYVAKVAELMIEIVKEFQETFIQDKSDRLVPKRIDCILSECLVLNECSRKIQSINVGVVRHKDSDKEFYVRIACISVGTSISNLTRHSMLYLYDSSENTDQSNIEYF